jgi:catechol 2,3-dioxygenase
MSEEQVQAPKAALTPKGINHLVLNVRNMEESHHFWSDMLGFKMVGKLNPPSDGSPGMNMQFYSGVVDGVNHHDLALVERDGLAEPTDWNMFTGVSAINHIAVTYPDRSAWLEQLAFLDANDVKMHLRIDHGMTHSMYIEDPNGYGVEVLYDLPEEVWDHDINGALNYADVLPLNQLTDTTDYVTNFS